MELEKAKRGIEDRETRLQAKSEFYEMKRLE